MDVSSILYEDESFLVMAARKSEFLASRRSRQSFLSTLPMDKTNKKRVKKVPNQNSTFVPLAIGYPMARGHVSSMSQLELRHSSYIYKTQKP